MSRKITILLFLMFLPVYLVEAGNIKGKVTDLQTGEPLIGANVLIVGTTFGAATDVNGEYEIRNLDAGQYDVKASYIGYQTVTVSQLQVNTGLTTELNFQLPSEGISVGEVQVVAARPLIQKDNTNAIRTINRDDIDAIPVRGVTNLIGFSAGVVIQDNAVYIRGGRIDEVGYYLEGTNIRNPITGNRGVSISSDAIEEIQVQAGGYTAEFGGANAGMVRQQLKTGSQDYNFSFEYITDNVGFRSKSDAFSGDKTWAGTYWYGYNEMSGILSGPILDPRFRFFLNADYIFLRDQNPEPFPGINLGKIVDTQNKDSIDLVYPAGAVQTNSSDNYNFAGTFTMDLSPIKVRLAGTYAKIRSDVLGTSTNPGVYTPVLNFLNPRIGESIGYNGAFSLKLTHVISKNLFYELQGGYFLQKSHDWDPYLKDNYWAYGDSAANAAVGWQWDRSVKDITSGYYGAYKQPSIRNILGFGFTGYGDIPTNYIQRDRQSWSVNGGLTYLLGKNHTFKIGGEYEKYTIRYWSIGGQPLLVEQLHIQQEANPSKSVEAIKRSLLVNNGVTNFGYDVFGNKISKSYDDPSTPINDGEFFGPHQPVFAGAYIQDKIEYEDIIVNAGVRFDYIDVDSYRLIDASRPDDGITSAGEIKPEGWTKVSTYQGVSPRLGFSFPVTDKTVFHAQFGKFVQQPKLNDIYQGYYRTAYFIKGGFFNTVPIGFDIRPTRTTQYEVGFTQLLTDFLSLDITGYYKDVKDQVVYVLQDTYSNSQFQSYPSLTNGDFATTKGLEITLNMRRFQRVMAALNLSLQDAMGTGSIPNSNRGIVGAPLDGVTVFKPVYISPLEFNQSLRGGLNIDYRFGPNDGPAVLHDFGASLLASYSSGHPFTLGIGAKDLEGDARNRRPVEPLNSSTTPSTFQVDLKIDKTFTIYDRLSANIYIWVINLFDKRNVENVFLRTGSPNDDGYISNPELSASLTQTYGQQYVDLYKALYIDYFEQYQAAANQLTTYPYLYGPPRQVRLGIKLSY